MWWYVIGIPAAAVLVARLLGGAIQSFVDGLTMSIDPPRSRRFEPRPERRGFAVLPAPAGSGPALGAGKAAIIRHRAPVPVVPVDVDAPGIGRGEGGTSNMLLELIEPIFQVAGIALEVADAASVCSGGVREAERLLRTPVISPARPETAVDAVMELRRKRAEATGQKPAVE
jgi:hypothetical protein